MAPSLNARQDMVVVKIPKLSKEAAASPSPRSPIPSSLLHQLRCRHARRRLPAHQAPQPPPLHQQGCFAGGTVLRPANDLAENNAGARFLLIYSEITAVTFRGPFDTHLDSLVGQALLSDGAVVVTVGKQISGEIEQEMAKTESKFLKHEKHPRNPFFLSGQQDQKPSLKIDLPVGEEA
ncbi:hypothetical protein RJ639_011746 [Escallonia herrerae]|uniref:chalcone synthase n=1 Tax=Escallonia herrerae TaxID=1293975 RepID=A0AA89AR50_9ASTE|nr:hypothetical protein RJ639_011746 [Escallonia herrerae]